MGKVHIKVDELCHAPYQAGKDLKFAVDCGTLLCDEFHNDWDVQKETYVNWCVCKFLKSPFFICLK